MNLIKDIDWKSLIIGAAVSAAIVIFASGGIDWLYPFSAIGLIYVGYKAKDLIWGTVLGAVAAIPMAILSLQGAFGEVSTATYSLETVQAIMVIAILLVGAIIGFVGAYAHRNRQKAIEQYEAKQKIGKNKNKKKK